MRVERFVDKWKIYSNIILFIGLTISLTIMVGVMEFPNYMAAFIIFVIFGSIWLLVTELYRLRHLVVEIDADGIVLSSGRGEIARIDFHEPTWVAVEILKWRGRKRIIEINLFQSGTKVDMAFEIADGWKMEDIERIWNVLRPNVPRFEKEEELKEYIADGWDLDPLKIP